MTTSILNEYIADKKLGRAVLIDVREAGEYRDFHVKDSILWPLSEIEKASDETISCFLAPYQQKNIYLHCRSGTRVLYAIEKLSQYHTSLIRITQSPQQIESFLNQ